MKYFGPWWDAPTVENGKAVLTPVGDECAGCEVPIELGVQGVMIPLLADGESNDQAWHRECFLRSTVGSPEHLKGTCSCHGSPGAEKGPTTPEENREEPLSAWGLWTGETP